MNIEIDKSIMAPISKIREIADSDPAPIEDCGFSKRTTKALKAYGINTVEDLIEFEYKWNYLTGYTQKRRINDIPGIGLAGLKEERAMFRSDEDNLYKTILGNRRKGCDTWKLRHDPILSNHSHRLNQILGLISLSSGKHLHDVTILIAPNIYKYEESKYGSRQISVGIAREGEDARGYYDYLIWDGCMGTKHAENTFNFIADIFKEFGYNVVTVFTEDEWFNAENHEYIKVGYININWEEKNEKP